MRIIKLKQVLIFAMLLITGSAFAQTIPANDLVARYNFDGNLSGSTAKFTSISSSLHKTDINKPKTALNFSANTSLTTKNK